MSLASMSSFAGEEDLHGLASMFPRLEAQLREAEKGFTSTMLRYPPSLIFILFSMREQLKLNNTQRHWSYELCAIK